MQKQIAKKGRVREKDMFIGWFNFLAIFTFHETVGVPLGALRYKLYKLTENPHSSVFAQMFAVLSMSFIAISVSGRAINKTFTRRTKCRSYHGLDVQFPAGRLHGSNGAQLERCLLPSLLLRSNFPDDFP